VAWTSNLEKPLVFVAVILPRTTGVRSAKDIRLWINQQMDLWQQGNYAALVDDTEAEALARIGTPPEPTEETRESFQRPCTLWPAQSRGTQPHQSGRWGSAVSGRQVHEDGATSPRDTAGKAP